MTLEEVINSQQDSDFLYIGSGSGFVFIGTKQEALEGVKEADRECFEFLFKKSIPNHMKAIVRAVRAAKHLRQEIKELESGNLTPKKKKMLDERYSRLTFCKTMIKQKQDAFNEAVDYAANWTDFLSREVKDIYPHQFVEPLGTTIIFEGTEAGKYWSYDEVNAKKGKTKKGKV